LALSQPFHLDNPVEVKMISNPIQIQKILNLRPDWTPKCRSCTPLVLTLKVRASGNIAFNREKLEGCDWYDFEKSYFFLRQLLFGALFRLSRLVSFGSVWQKEKMCVQCIQTKAYKK